MKKINIWHPLPESINSINVNILRSSGTTAQNHVAIFLILHSTVLLEFHWILHPIPPPEGGISGPRSPSSGDRVQFVCETTLEVPPCSDGVELSAVSMLVITDHPLMVTKIHDTEIKVKSSPLGLWTVVLAICRMWRSYLSTLLTQVCRDWCYCSSCSKSVSLIQVRHRQRNCVCMRATWNLNARNEDWINTRIIRCVILPLFIYVSFVIKVLITENRKIL